MRPGEKLRWEAKPAPRCYTFRGLNLMRFSALLFGAAVLAGVVVRLGGELHDSVVLSRLVFLLPLIALLLGSVPPVLARVEWPGVFYLLTDQRLIVLRGFGRRRISELELHEVRDVQFFPLGRHLAHVRIRGQGSPRSLTLCCIEYPEHLIDLLERAD
ncbi:hypothetical protein GSUB_10635 [Geoalkalibacter subterraneus]|uniref:YdbS-like PH domain-containing protein n=2 Tax=Geoalkalibacter subterraneus TaxID=483547 RepID=A0A0B5FQJ1_9BACT|nr:hypothetical protein GSUB_10635 [Geoalkalibacter subterraneus]